MLSDSDYEIYLKLLETIDILERAIKDPPIEYSKREILQKLLLAKQLKVIYKVRCNV
jgi:hypothetical protein